MMDDLISRQAAIEVIDGVFPVDPMKSEYAKGIACGAALAKTYVKQLPSAHPEQKRGKWIKGIDVPNRKSPYVHLADALYCSVCHKEAYWDTDYGQQLFAYCPNCGAKMGV